jgi:hypothetical protein
MLDIEEENKGQNKNHDYRKYQQVHQKRHDPENNPVQTANDLQKFGLLNSFFNVKRDEDGRPDCKQRSKC